MKTNYEENIEWIDENKAKLVFNNEADIKSPNGNTHGKRTERVEVETTYEELQAGFQNQTEMLHKEYDKKKDLENKISALNAPKVLTAEQVKLRANLQALQAHEQLKKFEPQLKEIESEIERLQSVIDARNKSFEQRPISKQN